MSDTIRIEDLRGMDFSDVACGERLAPLSPGEVLLEEFMKPYGLNANRLALALDVAPNRIGAIIKSERRITAETAVLLAHAFGTTAEFWLNLQTSHDLAEAARDIAPERIRRADQLARELCAA